MIVKIIQGLYPYNPGDIIDMPEHLARGQNAPYVEILKDQKTPVTDFQKQEMETTVIMGAPDEKDRVTKKIPEPKEYNQVIQLEDVPKAGKNQKAAETTTTVTTPEKTAEELQAEADAQAKADADAKAQAEEEEKKLAEEAAKNEADAQAKASKSK